MKRNLVRTKEKTKNKKLQDTTYKPIIFK